MVITNYKCILDGWIYCLRGARVRLMSGGAELLPEESISLLKGRSECELNNNFTKLGFAPQRSLTWSGVAI